MLRWCQHYGKKAVSLIALTPLYFWNGCFLYHQNQKQQLCRFCNLQKGLLNIINTARFFIIIPKGFAFSMNLTWSDSFLRVLVWTYLMHWQSHFYTTKLKNLNQKSIMPVLPLYTFYVILKACCFFVILTWNCNWYQMKMFTLV